MSLSNVEIPTLTCPICHQESAPLLWLKGEHHWFAKTHCRQCEEVVFFQVDTTPSLEESEPSWNEATKMQLEKEWQEWEEWKQKFPAYKAFHKNHTRIWTRIWISLMVPAALFFLLDYYHLLGLGLGNIETRQQNLNQYVAHLKELPCFSSRIHEILEEVPILYTPEPVYHHRVVQYGETGRYWGELRIKIHRSNFWFFGLPKKSRLIETIIHELRHRASPSLPHGERFNQWVGQDTQCALKHW